MPKSDNELMLSLAFTEHYFDASMLQQIGRDIKAGRTPQISAAIKEQLAPHIEEVRRITGIGRNPKRNTAQVHKHRLFNSPGLTWPFFAAIAALIMIWTLLGQQLRIVPSRDSPLLFGIVFGLLSGVVLFAIMRAFDRGRS
jgi:hypothetical protein